MRTTTPEGTPSPKPYMPLLWDAFYEFARMIFVGCRVTFGPRRGRRGKRVQELELLHARLSSFTLETSTIEIVRDPVGGARKNAHCGTGVGVMLEESEIVLREEVLKGSSLDQVSHKEENIHGF